MANFLYDSCAALAILRGEPGADIAHAHIHDSYITSVNLSEIGTSLINYGAKPDIVENTLKQLQFQILNVDEAIATLAYKLRPMTKRYGLSLGDRICLAAAQIHKFPVLTSDQIWKNLDLDVDIRFIR